MTREVKKGHEDSAKKQRKLFKNPFFIWVKLILDKMGRNPQEIGVRVKGREDWNKEKFPSKA